MRYAGATVLVGLAFGACAGEDRESERASATEASSFEATTPLDAILPPPQPPAGPGGRDYPHGGVTIRTYPALTSFGAADYTVYEPAAPAPAAAPVLAFFMGNFGALPSSITHEVYGAFYRHLARKGYIVIHPNNLYSSEATVKPGTTADEHDDIVAEVTAIALRELKTGAGHVRPATDDYGNVLLALGGHSWGGMLAQVLANQPGRFGLPVPRVLLLIDSTDRGVVAPTPNKLEVGNITLPKTWANVPRATRILHVRTTDSLVKTYGVDPAPYTRKWVWMDAEIRRMFATVPNEFYSYVYVPRDGHGEPSLESGHLSVAGTSSPLLNELAAALIARFFDPVIAPHSMADATRVDAVDFYGIWKPAEAMLNVVLKRRADDAVYAVAEGGAKFKSMGVWSDGVPVRTLQSKYDFDPYFDLSKPFGPMPEPPPAAFLSGSPKIRFAETPVGQSAEQKAIIANLGAAAPAAIAAVSLTGPDAAAFAVPGAVEMGVTFGVQFTPSRPGPHAATLTVEYVLAGVRGVARRELAAVATP